MPSKVSTQHNNWSELQNMFLAYVAGDSRVVEPLFLAIGNAVRGFFLARTHNPADSDDLAQATLLKIHLARHTFKADLSLKTWIFTISHRTLVDHWRKRSNEEFKENPEDIENSKEYLDIAVVREVIADLSLRTILQREMDGLKPLDRTLVYLSVEEGLTMAELASVVNATEGAVKVRLHRLFKSLRESLQMNDSREDSHA